MVAEFRLEDVNSSSAFFDVKKLRAFNGEYIRVPVGRRVHRRVRAVPAHRPVATRFDADVFAAMAPHRRRPARSAVAVPGDGRLPVPLSLR